MPVTCGIWLASRRLVAVVVDEEGAPSRPLTAELNDDARWGLLERIDAIHGLDVDLVLPDELARSDTIGGLALKRDFKVLVAPQRLIVSIRAVAGLRTAPPARTAALIARLPLLQAWRGHLRCLDPTGDLRQLSLL